MKNLLWSNIEVGPENAWSFYYGNLEPFLSEKEFQRFLEENQWTNFDEIRSWLRDYKNNWLTLAELRTKFNY